MNSPLLIGITGGIGSGKSTVCKIFAVLGIPIYEADSRARWIMNNHESLKEEIKATFGAESYDESGQLNRAFLAGQVFNDGAKVKQLNALVHPKVGQDFLNWVKENPASPYLLNEAALMFESGRYLSLNKVITVFAPEEMRIERVKKRDPQRSEAEIKAIIQKQMPEEEKLARADFIIHNDEKQSLISQVLSLHQELIKLPAS
ncbi:MAG: dephospho-CoA kinase [Bacteroidota bacterium]